MSTSLHLDLLKAEEHLSPNPVRLRVIVPFFFVLAILGIAVWWTLFAFRLHAATLQKAVLVTNIEGLKSAHSKVLLLRAQEKEQQAILKQLTFYRNSRICFAETFKRLAEQVPDTVQLTELRVPPPPPPPSTDPNRQTFGPTNVSEAVSLKLAGRASGDAPSVSVRMLLEKIRTPAFTNLIRSAEIPKGAFRQDTFRGPANQDTLLFEITCGCVPRRFE